MPDQAWDNSIPDGAIVQANTVDTIITNLKVAIQDRMAREHGWPDGADSTTLAGRHTLSTTAISGSATGHPYFDGGRLFVRAAAGGYVTPVPDDADVLAFRVNGAAQTMASGAVKTLETVVFNHGSRFDVDGSLGWQNAFKPNIAGIYWFHGALNTGSVAHASAAGFEAGLFKNAVIDTWGPYRGVGTSGPAYVTVDALIALNGSTDYVDLRLWHNLTSSPSVTGSLMGYLVARS